MLPGHEGRVPGFVGNCEGTDLTSGNFDVVVADGMSGNIALKATEGAAKFLLQELKGAFMSSLGTKIAALLIKKQMRQIKAKLSGDAKGGAILLGLRGVVLIGTVPRRSRPSRTVRLPRPRPCAPGLSRTLPILWTVSFYKGRVTWLNLYRVG